MSAEDEGRTEKATGKQRDKFREEGSVAKSNELGSFSQFLVAYIVLGLFGSYIAIGLGDLMIFGLTHLNFSVADNLFQLAALYVTKSLMLLGPLFAALVFGAVAISRVQFDFRVSWKAIKPKFNKINPFGNFKKVLITTNSLMELGKSLVKLTVLSFLVWLVVKPMMTELLLMYQFTPMQIGIRTWDIARQIWLLVILFMGVLGIGDFLWQKRQLEEKMKMTKQQIKDEYKQQESDPQMKAKLMQRGRQMLQSLMQQATSQADVVITNPTHFAVALSYKHGQMNAPKVVAKGMDHLAMKLRKMARQKEVPIVENRGLARALYHSTEVGASIPDNLFKPIAEILAFIYKLNTKKGAA